MPKDVIPASTSLQYGCLCLSRLYTPNILHKISLWVCGNSSVHKVEPRTNTDTIPCPTKSVYVAGHRFFFLFLLLCFFVSLVHWKWHWQSQQPIAGSHICSFPSGLKPLPGSQSISEGKTAFTPRKRRRPTLTHQSASVLLVVVQKLNILMKIFFLLHSFNLFGVRITKYRNIW